MIQATPFDLRLWTGINDPSSLNPAEFEDVHTRFTTRRDLLFNVNQQLFDNPTITDCTLRIPLSQTVFDQLRNTPPWSRVNSGTPLHKLKVAVLSMLQNRQKAKNVTMYLETGESEHFYRWSDPTDFFAVGLASDLCEQWVEVVGLCAFQDRVLLRNNPKPVAILSTWIITDQIDRSEARLERQHITRGRIEEQAIPLFSQSDMCAWGRMVRKAIWRDERLPFGPIGFCTLENWSPGERPRRYKNYYRDALGGLWEWEGGRAVDKKNPFGGHWNVQLPDASVKHRWVNWIEECTGREISTSPDSISHINVEPDGRIADRTFDWRA